MKIHFFLFVVFLLLAAATAQQQQPTGPNGTIYGVVLDQNGEPAKGIGLIAAPLGVALAAMLPTTMTNDAGEYRFERLPWWGRYTVYADDEKAGYSSISTGPAGNNHPPEVEISPENPTAQLKVYLRSPTGFVKIHLTNRRTGSVISGMKIAVFRMDEPESPFFTMSCGSDHVILVPPDQNLLLHVTSDGFREWDESIKTGKPINVASGTRLSLAVQLEPLD